MPIHLLSETFYDEGRLDLDLDDRETITELAVIAVPYAGGQVSRLSRLAPVQMR